MCFISPRNDVAMFAYTYSISMKIPCAVLERLWFDFLTASYLTQIIQFGRVVLKFLNILVPTSDFQHLLSVRNRFVLLFWSWIKAWLLFSIILSHLDKCLICFSTAVKRHHDKGNLQKKALNLWLIVLGVRIHHYHSREHDSRQSWVLAESLHLIHKLEGGGKRRESQQAEEL